MKFRTRFTEHNPLDYASKPEGESRTQQQFKEECDINNILKKYKRNGMTPFVRPDPSSFGNFLNVGDYQTALHKVMDAQQAFDQLPSEVRNKFHNDPSKLIGFLKDEKNNEEAYTLGLKNRPTKQPTMREELEAALDSHHKKTNPKKKSQED